MCINLKACFMGRCNFCQPRVQIFKYICIKKENLLIFILTAWSTNLFKYMPLTHDKRVYKQINNQYVSYAFLSLAGSMHLADLCSKQSKCAKDQIS